MNHSSNEGEAGAYMVGMDDKPAVAASIRAIELHDLLEKVEDSLSETEQPVMESARELLAHLYSPAEESEEAFKKLLEKYGFNGNNMENIPIEFHQKHLADLEKTIIEVNALVAFRQKRQEEQREFAFMYGL